MQEMSMDYHFKVEQEAGSSLCNFFGYNGICCFPISVFLRCATVILHVTLSFSVVLKKRELSLFMHAGTAGVWRTQAIVESGGWEERTTAEDMDLALRAGLLGWEFVYVGSIKVESFKPLTNRSE
jgi:beta-mannan synthase